MKSFKDHIKTQADKYKQLESIPMLFDAEDMLLLLFHSKEDRNRFSKAYIEFYKERYHASPDITAVWRVVHAFVKDRGSAGTRENLDSLDVNLRVPSSMISIRADKDVTIIWHKYGQQL